MVSQRTLIAFGDVSACEDILWVCKDLLTLERHGVRVCFSWVWLT
jgi:hypothetical protein